MKKSQINVRASEETRVKLEALCKAHFRTQGQTLEWLIEKEYRRLITEFLELQNCVGQVEDV